MIRGEYRTVPRRAPYYRTQGTHLKMHPVFQDAILRGLKAPDRGQVDYTDTHTPGLTLRVGKRTKTFMFVRSAHGRRERITIGQFPAVTLGRAREEARKLAAEKTLGLLSPRTNLSFSAALEEFLVDDRRKNRASTVHETERLLRRHFRFTGDITSITAREIVRAIDAIAAHAEQHHAYVASRTFFNWLTKRRLIPALPARRGGAAAQGHLPRTGAVGSRVDRDLARFPAKRLRHDHPPRHLRGQRMGQLAGLRGEFVTTIRSAGRPRR